MNDYMKVIINALKLWVKNNLPEIATDDEIIDMIAQEDMLPVVADSDGSLLTDENNNILLW